MSVIEVGGGPHATRAHVELSFKPGMELVPAVRRFVASVYERLLASAEEASRIGIATHELLENAVRCAADGAVALRIEVDVSERAEVIIRTTNRARPGDLSALLAIVGAAHAAPDPLAHYTKLMRANAMRADGSGLGLARIRAECDLEIEAQADGELVTVHARGRVGQKEGS